MSSKEVKFIALEEEKSSMPPAIGINNGNNAPPPSAFYEYLAFYCGKLACCYYSDDIGKEEIEPRKWEDKAPSNHECPRCLRCACIGVTIGTAIVGTALLVGGAISYADNCLQCCFPRQYYNYTGDYTCCTPDCRTPFMAAVGTVEAATICPSTTAYGAYCCADCMNKEEFKKKFKEGQSCLPEHRLSIRNFFSLFNPCCGPTTDSTHQS